MAAGVMPYLAADSVVGKRLRCRLARTAGVVVANLCGLSSIISSLFEIDQTDCYLFLFNTIIRQKILPCAKSIHTKRFRVVKF